MTGLAANHRFAADDYICEVDGVIYNRAELGGEGNDAQLVARLVRERGVASAVGRLNGDFAISLVDRQSGAVWLVRDRLGVRPLYYLRDRPNQFASSPGPLLTLPGVSRLPLPSFVARYAGSHYRTFDNDPEASPYENLRQVPAGHVAHIANGRVDLSRYWDLDLAPDAEGSEAELSERYRELIVDAVGLRLRDAGRLGFTLSGGMDSSTVLGTAAYLTGRGQPAYSVVYPGSEYDESEDIPVMVNATTSEWRPIAVQAPDVFKLVKEMISVHEEPVATATWLSHHLMCKEVARAGVETLFGGLGGDELNAGEYEYFLYHFADLRVAGAEETLRHEVETWIRHHDHPIYRKNWHAVEEGFQRLVDLEQPGVIRADRARIERYQWALNRDFFDLTRYEHVLDHRFHSYLKNRTYQDLFRETTPCCLRAENRHTRALGLRSCDPFLDHRLVEFMFRVPGTMKIKAGVTKHLLRKATSDLVPEVTRQRIKKTGWNAPADQWFTGAGRDMLHDLVSSSDFQAAHVYDVDAVRRLIDEHEEIVTSGRAVENHMMFLWQLVNLEAWFRWLRAL